LNVTGKIRTSLLLEYGG